MYGGISHQSIFNDMGHLLTTCRWQPVAWDAAMIKIDICYRIEFITNHFSVKR